MYGIDVAGIKESLAALERVERLDAQADLRKEFTAMAESAIANAKGNALDRMQKRAADTLAATGASGKTSASTSTAAVIRFGGGFEGAFGAEYGAEKGLQRVVSHFGYYRGWNQFRLWKGSGSNAGYFLWPGIRTAVDEHRPRLAEAIVRNFGAGSELPAPNIAAGASLISSVFGT